MDGEFESDDDMKAETFVSDGIEVEIAMVSVLSTF